MFGSLILRWLSGALALWLTSQLFGGIVVADARALLIAALAIAALNVLVRPLLFLVTLPLTVVTLGLFVFIINGIVLKLAAWLVNGFAVDGFFTAVFGAIVLGLLNMLISSLLGERGPDYIYIEHTRT